MTPKKMTIPKMKMVGSYRPPSMVGYNMPRRGRVGKMMPSLTLPIPRKRR